jgi:hypothetical protein
MCTILLGPGPAVHNFFLVNVLAYQARSGTGSVDKIDEHPSAGEGTFSRWAILLNESD